MEYLVAIENEGESHLIDRVLAQHRQGRIVKFRPKGFNAYCSRKNRRNGQSKSIPMAKLRCQTWDDVDEAFLLEENGLTLQEKAICLGRTRYGVKHKRDRLLAMEAK